ncbi:helix-turn-helix domain-containing protein [Moellerella wisconsensis]|uniref:Helix-turn-helix domain-containing protein n=3 Tax=Moellerella wisconsensis TaxID=158849 RepID=A0A9Q8V3F6_9GAMM|nr:helix-turn-helix transcriptional regulator [Moellerella wisconsensis]KLN95535.1 hypothetical protein VK86_15055 [Moellerella wisconsensis]UNH30860.1 helix-turn-helix domain-containing protein [Moellerella wisconsensis]UNH39003.1 helix-turn-helix domain-containing protein [Moellerella wisconsensis]UNH42524.1 helix-turn-helix domain-containing protein [Moellerella wisconsensis]
MIYEDNQLSELAGIFFKNLRKKNRISEKELAALLKVSQQQVSRYENGKTQLTIVKINQYLTVFGLSWGDFLEGLNKEKDVIYSNTNLH